MIKQTLKTFEEIRKDMINKLPKNIQEGANTSILVDAFASALFEQQESLRIFIEELNNED